MLNPINSLQFPSSVNPSAALASPFAFPTSPFGSQAAPALSGESMLLSREAQNALSPGATGDQVDMFGLRKVIEDVKLDLATKQSGQLAQMLAMLELKLTLLQAFNAAASGQQAATSTQQADTVPPVNAASSDAASGAAGGAGAAGASALSTSGGNADQAASEVATIMAGYNYQYYYDDKKSNAQTQSQKSGNCCDLAQVAMDEFRKRGVECRMVLGKIKSKNGTNGHYWLEYYDRQQNKWKFFDPTACASSHSAQKGFTGLDASYGKPTKVFNN